MNLPLTIRVIGMVGFVFFSGASAVTYRLLHRETLAVKFAILAMPFFAMAAIINDW